MPESEKPCGEQPQGFGDSQTIHPSSNTKAQGERFMSKEQIHALHEQRNSCVQDVDDRVAEIQRRRAVINKAIDKILMSRLPADTKVDLIRAQRAKLKELSTTGGVS